MDKPFYEKTKAYLDDLLPMAADQETERSLRQLISYVQDLSSLQGLTEKEVSLCVEIGNGFIKVSLGDSGLNQEYARTYLDEALSLWPEEPSHEKALVLKDLGLLYGIRGRSVSPEDTEKAIGHLNQALSIWDRESNGKNWAIAMYALGSSFLVREQGDPKENKEKAIDCLEQTLSIWTAESSPVEWARSLFELGQVFIMRIEGDPATNLEKAIELLNQSLSVRTKDAYPIDWAMTMYALGNAHASQTKGDPADNLEEAINRYNLALSIWTKETSPANWATTMKALAGVFTVRLEGNPKDNLERAIDCLYQTLSVWTKEAAPMNWADTMYALGSAYGKRIEGSPRENKEEAIKCLKQALLVCTREQAPMDWAMTMHALGHDYKERIEGNPAENREMAIDCFNQILTVWKKDVIPLRWAYAMFGLANAYGDRLRGDPAQNREKALDCVLQALSEWKKEVVPMNWAMGMYVLGEAYSARISGDPAENDEKAIECFEELLSVWTRKVAPIYWAMTMHNLGRAYWLRIKGDPEANREKAIEYYRRALTVRKKRVVPQDWAKTLHALGDVYRSRTKGDPAENNKKSISYYNRALQVRKRETVPRDWAHTMCELGSAYAAQLPGDSTERDGKAVECFNQALSVWTRDVDPLQWATAMFELANAHANRASGERLDNLREAVRCYEAVLEAVETGTPALMYLLAQGGLAYSLQHLGELQGNAETLEQSFRAFGEAFRTISAIHIEIADPKGRKDYLRRRIDNLSVGLHFMLDKKRYGDAMCWLEKIRSQGLLEDINLDQLTPRNHRAVEPAREYWQLCRSIRNLRAVLSLERGGRTTESEGSELRLKQKEHYEALKDQLSRRKTLLDELTELDPDYVSLIHPEPLTEQELHELLSRTGSAAVECFFRRNSADLHFLIAYPTDSGVAYTHLLVDLRPILLEQVFGRFLDALHNSAPELSSLVALLEETGKIVEPLADLLKELGIKRIYLSPHAFLDALPLHAAILPHTRTYFIEDFDVCYTPSLTLSYRLFSSKTRAGKKVIALFPSSLKEKPLEYGKEEFGSLFNTYGQERLIRLDGAKATLQELASCLEKVRGELSLIEFICHGRISPDGITLHLAKGDVSHVDMMKELSLGGLPLAVLAACETGKSDEWSNTYEEYMALDSVFLQMGAKGVVSTLYPINDQGACQVMKEFHQRLKKEGCPVNALHQAQRRILKEGFVAEGGAATRGGRDGGQCESGKCPSTHPYYWAFFKYSGTFPSLGGGE